MTERFGQKCSEGCDFVIALQGRDFETIEPGVEAYEKCPNCGAELEEVYVYQPKLGFLKAVAGGEQ